MRNILDTCSCGGMLIPDAEPYVEPFDEHTVMGARYDSDDEYESTHTFLKHLYCNRCGGMFKAAKAGATLENLRAEQYKLGKFFPLHPRTAPCPHCTGNAFLKELAAGPYGVSPAEPEDSDGEDAGDQKIGVYCVACNTVRCVLTAGGLEHFDDEVAKVAEAIKRNRTQ